jgi:biotin synthase
MNIIEKLRKTDFETLTEPDVIELLTVEGEKQQELFQWARDVRRESGGNEVLLRGVIEISNSCQKYCDYCAMRSANKELSRYSLSPDKILSLAQDIKDAGIQVVFLQGGQYPSMDSTIEQVVPVIKNEMGMEILLCLGERPKEGYEKFASLGVDSYILKYETSDSNLYREIAHGPLEKRLQAISNIRAAGLKLGTGNIIGLPNQTMRSLFEDILLGIKIKPDFISSSPFIPNANTPLENHPHGSVNLTLNTMAIYRIVLKTPLIPSVSALESVYKSGQKIGLDAGANVMTINFTPKDSQSLYKIYSDRRFVVSLEHALRTIESAGLQLRQPSSPEQRINQI